LATGDKSAKPVSISMMFIDARHLSLSDLSVALDSRLGKNQMYPVDSPALAEH
jgi:hypothetical protein